MALPIAGVSEVGTAIIAHKSPTGMAAQSCIRLGGALSEMLEVFQEEFTF